MTNPGTEDGRITCELDDLMRLYKAGQTDAIQHAGRQLAAWIEEMMKDLEPKWKKDHIGDGIELGEHMVLASLCALLLDYLRNERTGKDNKKHHEACVLHDVV